MGKEKPLELTCIWDIASAEIMVEQSDAEAGAAIKVQLRELLEYAYWRRAHPEEAAEAEAAWEKLRASLKSAPERDQQQRDGRDDHEVDVQVVHEPYSTTPEAQDG